MLVFSLFPPLQRLPHRLYVEQPVSNNIKCNSFQGIAYSCYLTIRPLARKGYGSIGGWGGGGGT